MNPEALYELAYECHRQGVYPDASRYFRLLTYMNPLEKRYWMALAASLQEGEQYQDAVYAYAMASLLEETDPLPHFYAAGCYFSMDNVEDAFKALVEAEERLPHAAQPLVLKTHIRAIRKGWGYKTQRVK